MIPVKLAVRNFMCYRDNVPPLSLEGIHVACLCGDNGNGKSALLDAMTWALWGKARSNSADELVHLGQAEMEVEFEFAVGPQRYRVIRKYSKPAPRRAGKTLLEFQVAGDGEFKSVAGNSQRETQQRIIDSLGMDYDTFINSALLLQGRADEFTMKQPAQRKELLADILGLSYYDKLEERAKSRGRENENQRRQLSSAIADIDLELATKAEHEAELKAAEEALVGIDDQMGAQEALLDSLRQRKQELVSKRERMAEIDRRLDLARRELGYWEDQLKKHRDRIAEFQQVLAQRTAIEEGYARFLEAKRANDDLNEKLRLSHDINEHKGQLTQAIERAKGELASELRLVSSGIEEREARFRKLPQLREELSQGQARLGELADQEAGLEERKRRINELSAQLHRLESMNARRKEEVGAWKEKLDLLAQGDARCPLCETELGVEGRQRIEAKYQAEGRAKADAYRANQGEIERQRKEQRDWEREVTEVEGRTRRERIASESRMMALQRDIAQAEQLGAELTQQKAKLAEIEARLAKGDFAVAEQRSLQDLEGRSQALGYDADKHRAVRGQLAQLEKYEAIGRKLEEAQTSLPQEEANLSKAEEQASGKLQSLKGDEQEKEIIAGEIAALPDLSSRLEAAERDYKGLVERRRDRHAKLVEADVKLRRCLELEQTRREKAKLLRRASEEEAIYKELAEAFGKKGIQAWIIEEALPEIEAEANRLLGRMTDNRMHIALETQREAKTGGVIETLDIKIADELGTRNYEMFSGGEAFRINFALRIALSKLLARRAGAPLSTLIMDEGFGTQDSAGKEKLVEAINSIQDDFEKIIVITHIEELKDMFPVRIDIAKTSEGSTISVN
ncbi:MAG: SMC family ATPase [Dehalococcoidia bacterium]